MEEDTAEVFSSCMEELNNQAACTCGIWGYPKPSSAANWSDIMQKPSAHDYLLGEGFHRTYWPFAASSDTHEYTKPHSYQSHLCGNGTFRDHALVDNITDYRIQLYTGWTPPGEPNPEVHETGPWPYIFWPAYVLWWRITHTRPLRLRPGDSDPAAVVASGENRIVKAKGQLRLVARQLPWLPFAGRG